MVCNRRIINKMDCLELNSPIQTGLKDEFSEYPKRVYKGDESIIVNTVAEENEFWE